MKLRFLFFALALFFSIHGICQTTVSGIVSGNWSKDHSPYIVDGDLTIPSGKNLIIGPGVKVIFKGYFKIVVEGQFIALGNRNDSIVFTVSDTTGYWNKNIPDGSWQGMTFFETYKKQNIVSHCVFEFAKKMEGSKGGAIYLSRLSGSLEIRNSVFRNNKSSSGGALFYDGSTYQGNLRIKNCGFYNNYATVGGALMISSFGCLQELSGSVFSNNKSEGSGGAILLQASNNKIYNCLFKDNSSGDAGGAIWNVESTSTRIYNSIFDNNSAPVGAAYYTNMGAIGAGLFNCTIINNNSSQSCIAVGDNLVIDFYIVNSIIWNPNSPEIFFSPNVTNKIIESCIIRDASDSIWFSNSCEATDPLLVYTGPSKYYPSKQSPCIDKGNKTYLASDILVDYNYKCRSWDGDNNKDDQVDIGALELNSVDSIPAISSDLNDAVVCEGSDVNLTVGTLFSDTSYRYTWFSNSDSISQVSASLNLNSVNPNNSSFYFCRIKNKYGEVQSKTITLNVLSKPEKPSKPIGLDTIKNFTDSVYYNIQPINNTENLKWQLTPLNSGSFKYKDSLAVIKWNSNYNGVAYLTVTNENGQCVSTSDTLKVYIDNTIGAFQNLNDNKITIYPNPSNGIISIDLKGIKKEPIEIIITDNLGKILKRESVCCDNRVIEYKLPKGLFFIIVRTGSGKIYSNKTIII